MATGFTYRHYILKDHLGSWTTITDAEGNVEQELSYDAWGNLRAPETWYNHTQAEPIEAPMFDRGYTGHEHLDAFGLINMNGRMYDPMLGRMLSPDIVVQQTDYTQSCNRYSYCFNNPLRFTDPTGWVVDVWEIDDCGNIVNRIEDKTQDAFYLVKKDENGKYERVKDEDGNYKSITFDYGTVERQKTISFFKAGVKGNYDTYEVRGDENGTRLFEYFAEVVCDRRIEVSHAKTGIAGEKGLDFITTAHWLPIEYRNENGKSHIKSSEPGMTYLYEGKLKYGYTIREMNHSHPNSGIISKADFRFATQISTFQSLKQYPIPAFNIYDVSKKKYYEFGAK
ncbi:MAG: hypothetical protein KBT57_01800 [bacterium]|nr:hypothetical protein [Candidatus Limimorpha equi]